MGTRSWECEDCAEADSTCPILIGQLLLRGVESTGWSSWLCRGPLCEILSILTVGN